MELLGRIGVSPSAEAAYVQLLRHGPPPGADAASEPWLELLQHELIQLSTAGEIEALPPRPVIESWALRREHEATLARDTAAALSDLYATRAGAEPPFAEIINGRSAAQAVFRAMADGATSLVRSWDRGPYPHPVIRGAPPQQLAGMARGVRYQAVYDGSSLADPRARAALRESTESGEDARIFPELPMKMIIADEDRALITLPQGSERFDALVVHPSILLTALVEMFDMIWGMSLPVNEVTAADARAGDTPGELDRDTRHVLTMLTAGMTDEAIARSLGVSERTVQRRVRLLQQRVGARTRFQLGAMAAQRGWMARQQRA